MSRFPSTRPIDPLTHTVLRPVPGVSRSSAISTCLRNAIILGIFTERQQIPNETALTRIFDVAPMTIREALTSLRADGLIVTRRGRSGGSFVSADAATTLVMADPAASMFDATEVAHHVSAISGKAAALAAERASAEEVRDLAAAAARFDEMSAQDPTLLPAAQAAAQVAVQLARASQSPRLTRELIASQIEWIPWAVRAAEARTLQDGRTDERQKAFDGLADAVLHRDGAKARAQVEEYIAHQLTDLTPALSPRGTTPEAAQAAAGRLTELLTAIKQAVVAVSEKVPDPDFGTSLFDACAEQLQNHPLLSGIGLAAAPDSGRESVDWFVRESPRGALQSERIRRRGVDLSASAPGEEGYRGFDWYTLPASRGQSTVVGPYVDFLCGDEYTLTLSVPAVHDGIFTGVFVADIAVGAIEHELLPHLSGAESPLVVAHVDGRVLVSTDVDAPVGTVLNKGTYKIAATADPFPYQVVSLPGQVEGEHHV